MKKFMMIVLVLSLLLVIFDYYFIFKPFFSLQASPESKKIILEELSKNSSKPWLFSKKTLDTLVYPNILPQYLRHTLSRNGIKYTLKIDESTHNIPIELNHQAWYVHTNGEIITSLSGSIENGNGATSKVEALFSVQIHTNIDQMEAYRKYIQEFVRFLLNSENSIVPSIKTILYDETIGLSYVDYRGIHIILGKNTDYNMIKSYIDILNDPKIQLKIEESAYNELDFRFDKKIICRFHSKNP
jgi:hypothetical protein